MKNVFLKALMPFIILSTLSALSSCIFLTPLHYDTHTVTINLPAAQGRFANANEAQSYTKYYEIRLYKYQYGSIQEKPVLTKVLSADDLSFTCDTGYYYLEMDAWAEETGTVVTGRGSTKNTESFDDGIQVTPGVFELSSNQLTASVTVEMHTASEEEYPVWNINWNLNGGQWKDGFTPDTTFDWRRMHPLTTTSASMGTFPTSGYVVPQSEESSAVFLGWYLTPDGTGTPVTGFQQLPLQDVTLYALWTSAFEVETDISVTGVIEFSLALTSGGDDSEPTKTVTAASSMEWPEGVTFTWLLDDNLQEESSDTFTFTCTTQTHTVTCIATAGLKTGSQSITVTYDGSN